ncbi:MAG: general secretion pathway protein GspJ [Gammaproteobacteria bacterium]|nr:MAG: general secretion pathway protein GspJ [Gammaproteobacteria bacterium]RLA61218.1 MAG: general secretion pathway protein GspJ [Gammaproteobacteria bacterium]
MNQYPVQRGSPEPAHKVWQRGFTLVEVMVALTILSLVMLATVTGLRTLANTQVAIERMTGRVDEVRTVSGFLRDALESSIIGSNTSGMSVGGLGSDATFFEISSDSLAWKSTVLFGEGFGGSHMIRVAREDDRLVLRWQEPTWSGRPVSWNTVDSRTLVSDLDEFKLSFRKDFTSPWMENWDSKKLPALVRLQVRAAGRYWPDLIFSVRGAR